jgi:hypothetical protein
MDTYFTSRELTLSASSEAEQIALAILNEKALKVDLAPSAAITETLALFQGDTELSALEVDDHFNIDHTAANNRLCRLRALGFLTRRARGHAQGKDNRTQLYSRAKRNT